jgi:hypothetical protein
MLEHLSGTASFFQAMAPVLIANVLTVAFVYSFAKIAQKELRGEAERRNSSLTTIEHCMHAAPLRKLLRRV